MSADTLPAGNPATMQAGLVALREELEKVALELHALTCMSRLADMKIESMLFGKPLVHDVLTVTVHAHEREDLAFAIGNVMDRGTSLGSFVQGLISATHEWERLP